MSLAPAPLEAADHVDHEVVLRDVPWEQYLALDAARGDSAVPRLTYDAGTLTITSPSTDHERVKKCLARLIEVWSEVCGVDLEGVGSWTLRDVVQEKGLEPDECYILGDPAGREVPDFAVEVVWTSGVRAELPIYAGLGVREVWVWEAGTLAIHALRGGSYVVLPRSELLPELEPALVAGLATERQPVAVRRLRAALAGR